MQSSPKPKYPEPAGTLDSLMLCIVCAISGLPMDLRRGSPRHAQLVETELSAEDKQQLGVPVGSGCTHGFLLISKLAKVQYKTNPVASGITTTSAHCAGKTQGCRDAPHDTFRHDKDDLQQLIQAART